MTKYLSKFFRLSLFVSFLIFVNACETDQCKDVDCGANGVCFEGNCICDPGYGGADCDIVLREPFIGTYTVTEDCGGVMIGPYTVEITEAGDFDKVLLKNLGNYNCLDGGGNPVDYFVEGVINSEGVIDISDNVCDTQFEASGSLSEAGGVTTIIITYSATYDPGTGTTTDNCTATLIR